MKNDAAGTRPRSRPRKKNQSVAVTPPPEPSPAVADSAVRVRANVGSLESAFSLLLGVLFVLAAIFPRSLKQFLFLGLGGGLVYRGLTSHCEVYEALEVDTTKDSLLRQVQEKYLGPGSR